MRAEVKHRLFLSIVFIVFVVSITVVAGWYLHIEALKSVLPGFPSMKVTTAICFYVSGVILIGINQFIEGKVATAQTVLPIASLFLFVVVSTFVAALFLNIPSGFEFIFDEKSPQRIMPPASFRPSYGTLLAFYIIGCTGLLSIHRLEMLPVFLSVMGWCVTLIGSVALLGFALNLPVLYFAHKGNAMGMSLHSATLFCLIGLALLLLSQKAGEKL